MPLLHDNQKSLLVNVNQRISDDSDDLTNLIKDPKQFFGNKTDIFYVHPETSDENSNENNAPLTLDEIKITTVNAIKSGQKITSEACKKWIFVPYNIEDKNRTYDFLSQLEKKGFDKDKLQSDPNYVFQNIMMKDSRQKLKQAYKNVDGTVNENSLLLYSGPDSYACLTPYMSAPGCIYTGDCNLNKISLNTIYQHYSKNVGTLQIPHHGSRYSFNINSFSHFKNIKWLPVSFSVNNRYHHPHNEVTNELNVTNCYQLIEITKKKSWRKVFPLMNEVLNKEIMDLL